jgi:hypothetical protein
MKINSNTISLDREEYAAVEKVIEKIASDNKIDNITEVKVVLSPESGTIKFRSAEDISSGDVKEESCSETEKKKETPVASKDEDEG